MGSPAILAIKIVSDAKQAKSELDAAGGSVNKFGKIAAGIGATVAAIGLAKFGKDSINAFETAAKESLKLQRVMGGTIEQVSQMRFAAIYSGVSVDSFTKSMGKLDKALVTAAGSTKQHAALTKELGFAFTDTNGKIIPTNTLLLKLADRFAKMPNGAEKTALAMKLFGKSGTDMLPMLNKGSKGLQELIAESDKYGFTLTGKNVSAVKAAINAHRDMDKAMQGLKIQIGAQLLPIVTKLTLWFEDKVIPVIVSATGFVRQHSNVIGLAVSVIVGLIVVVKAVAVAQTLWNTATIIARGAVAAWTAAQWLLNAALSANPIALVVVAIAGLIAAIVLAWKHSQTFRAIVTGAFNAVLSAVRFVWNWIKSNWPLLLAILTGPIGAAVLLIVRNWDRIKDGATTTKDWIVARFNDMLNFFKSMPGKIAGFFKGVWSGIANGLKDAINNVLGLPLKIPRIDTHIPGVPTFGGQTIIPRLATGGITTGPTLAMIGDNRGGREAVIPLDQFPNALSGRWNREDMLALASLIVAGLAKQLGDLRLSNQQMVEAFAREINAAAAR